MSDILDEINIHVDCAQCDATFDIAASVVAESHDLLEGGCPGTDYECPASLFAELVDRDALRHLAEAWREIEQSVRDSIGQISLQAHPTLERLVATADGTNPSQPHSARPDDAGVVLNLGRGERVIDE